MNNVNILSIVVKKNNNLFFVEARGGVLFENLREDIKNIRLQGEFLLEFSFEKNYLDIVPLKNSSFLQYKSGADTFTYKFVNIYKPAGIKNFVLYKSARMGKVDVKKIKKAADSEASLIKIKEFLKSV